MVRYSLLKHVVVAAFTTASVMMICVRAFAAEPQLKRVMLSSGGVAYFEYQAPVEGDAELTLPVRLDQVDDILKSVVIFDDKGGVGTIRLQSQASLDEIFRDLPFGPKSLSSMPALLSAMRGAEVEVRSHGRMIGRIATVEPERQTTRNGGQRTVHRVGLMTRNGLRDFVLEDADSVQFTDKDLDSRIKLALQKMVTRSGEESRTLIIRSKGDGARTLTIGYIVAAPLWKSSYRLVVPAAGALPQGPGDGAAPANADLPQGRLQGWAVVDNASGQDWTDVELTLSSGNPVTFRQALYATYYVDRPEVPLQVMGKILPRPDEGAVRGEEAERKQASMNRAKAAMMPPPPAEPEAAYDMGAAGTGAMEEQLLVTAQKEQAGASEGVTQIDFSFKEKVSVENGQSIVVPIIDRNMPVERVDLFDPEQLADFDIEHNPLAAVRVVNDSDTSLPPGALTLYEAGEGGKLTFVGDARINTLPKGDERLVAHALDPKTHIEWDYPDQSRQIQLVKLADGVMETKVIRRRVYDYQLKAPETEDRRVILVIDDDGDIENQRGFRYDKSDNAYRVYVDLKAGEERKLDIGFHDVLSSEVRFVDLGDDAILRYFPDDVTAFLLSNVGDNEELRAAVTQVRDLRGQIQAAKDQTSASKRRIDAVYKEQERIRENIKALGDKTSAIYRRYLAKLNEQEDLLEDQQKKIDQAAEQLKTAYGQLRALVAGLDFNLEAGGLPGAP